MAFGLPLLECLVITSVALAVGTGYHLLVYGMFGPLRYFAIVGGLVSVLFTLPFLFRNEYTMAAVLAGRRRAWRILVVWTYAFVSLGAIGFLTKTTSLYSRGWLLVLFVAGLLAVEAIALASRRLLERARSAGKLARRRVAVVGADHDVARLAGEMQAYESDIALIATVPLTLPIATADPSDGFAPGRVKEAAFDDMTRLVIERLRAVAVDDVILVAPSWDSSRLHRLVDRLAELPAAISLGGIEVLDRFASPRSERIGGTTTLAVTAPPLTPLQRLAKRFFDIVFATLALVALAPLLGLIALAVRLDSPGKALFRQRRRGFNQEVFEIYKFRSMTTLDDGDHVVQAKEGDRRITRVGAYLRRWSLDELPQLLNVLAGDMSIVGPRPHAVAHDRHYERRIQRYPRRLNVKPGMTGWAQVNGLRGETNTEDKMRARVEHDLYYVDNWSFGFDLHIVLLTVVSPKTWMNAR